MGRPFGTQSERRHDRPSVVRRRARTGQSPDPRAADICPVGPRAAALPSAAPRSSPGVVRFLGRFPAVQHDWIAAALHPFAEHRVSSLVPPVFDAYCRVFHPAVRCPDDELFGIHTDDADEDVTWAEVAAFNGRTAHPAMEWTSITGSWQYRGPDDQPGPWDDAPAEGHLPVERPPPPRVTCPCPSQRDWQPSSPATRAPRTTASSASGRAAGSWWAT